MTLDALPDALLEVTLDALPEIEVSYVLEEL